MSPAWERWCTTRSLEVEKRQPHCWQLNTLPVLLGKLLLLESQDTLLKDETIRESDTEEFPKLLPLLRKEKDEDDSGSSMPVIPSVECL